MQHDEYRTQPAGTMTHPDENEWMEFLYDETAPGRKGELQRHLQACSICAERVRTWRSSMQALGAYPLPIVRTHRKFYFTPVLRWAAAAALILLTGFALGRLTSDSDRRIRELQASVARLQRASTTIPNESAILVSATQVATEETVRLLSEYTRMASLHNTQERQATVMALRALEEEYQKLRSGLETLAVNTEDGLHLTHENLARLAAHSISRGDN